MLLKTPDALLTEVRDLIADRGPMCESASRIDPYRVNKINSLARRSAS